MRATCLGAGLRNASKGVSCRSAKRALARAASCDLPSQGLLHKRNSRVRRRQKSRARVRSFARKSSSSSESFLSERGVVAVFWLLRSAS